MGIFSLFRKKKFILTIALFTGFSLYNLNIGKQAEHMAKGNAEVGSITPLTGYVVTVKPPIGKSLAIPMTPGGKILVYDDPATAEKVAMMVKERMPKDMRKGEIRVEDIAGYQNDADEVYLGLVQRIKDQVEKTFEMKGFVKGPLPESLMLDLNKKACEMVGIQTSTWNFREERILNWMKELIEKASTDGNLDFDLKKGVVKDAKF